MEQITAVISAALAIGLNEVGKTAAKDAYSTFKNKLSTILGQESEALQSLEKLEARPESKECLMTLNEELAHSKANEHPDIQELLAALASKLEESESGQAALSQFNIKAEKIGAIANTIEHIELKF